MFEELKLEPNSDFEKELYGLPIERYCVRGDRVFVVWEKLETQQCELMKYYYIHRQKLRRESNKKWILIFGQPIRHLIFDSHEQAKDEAKKRDLDITERVIMQIGLQFLVKEMLKNIPIFQIRQMEVRK